MSELTQEELQQLSLDREERVKPVVRKVLQAMLDSNLLLSDTTYVEAVVRQNLEAVFKTIVFAHLQSIFDQVEKDMTAALRIANIEIWGKDPDDVDMEDIDKLIKKAVKRKKK